MEYDAKKIGQTIRAIRKSKGVSLKLLSDTTELSSNFLGDIERGIKNPSIQTLLTVCNALKTSPDEVLYQYINIANEDDKLTTIKNEIQELNPDQKEIIINIIKEIKRFK